MQRYGGLAHPKMGKSFQCHCQVWANIEGMRSNIFEILLWKLVWTSHWYFGKKTVLPTNEHLQFQWFALWSRENSQTQIIIYSWQTTLQKWAHTNQASKAIYFQQTYFWLTSFRLSQGPRQLEVTTWLSFRQWSIWLSWFCFLDLFTLTWKKLCLFISAQVRLSGILKCSPNIHGLVARAVAAEHEYLGSVPALSQCFPPLRIKVIIKKLLPWLCYLGH